MISSISFHSISINANINLQQLDIVPLRLQLSYMLRATYQSLRAHFQKAFPYLKSKEFTVLLNDNMRVYTHKLCFQIYFPVFKVDKLGDNIFISTVFKT